MHLKSLLKTNALIIITLLMSFSAFAQAPNLLNYQGVARNNVGNPLPNQSMKLRLSVHDLLPSGAIVYSEIRAITTNLGGLFSVQIGSAGASSSTGTLGGVNWVVGNKFLQVELDPASNNNYIDIGTVQLVSVPYAFGAGTAATVKTNANLTGVVTSVGNATSIANGAITSDMIGTLNKSKVGLDLVNNTSDAAKPISELTQVALGTKLNISDSANGYITPTQLASYNFSRGNSAVTIDTTNLSNRINLKSNAVDVNNLATVVAANTASITAETIRATAAEVILTSKIASNTASITASTAAINLKASADDLATLTTNVTSNTGSITSNTTDIAILKTNIASNTASISSNTAALALKANIASPIFTGTVTTGVINTGSLSSTSVTAPTYASTPKTLSYTGTTINWDPAQGLNAAITLSQNSTLSFTAAPPVGTYGTIVLTQDGTGSRTINLPTIASVTNKVLGSTSTSTVALSTAANSKDILNFYFDGTNCYWNIGQGYGAAAASSSSGNTNLILTTTGTGSATLSGTTLNIPSSSFTGGTINNRLSIEETTGLPLEISSNNNWQTVFKLENTSVPKAWEFGIGGSTNTSTLGVGKFGIYEGGARGAYRFAMSPGGNVQIGTTTDAGYKLDVNGTGRFTGSLRTGDIIFPTAHGTINQVLSTTGSGTLVWATAAGGLPTSGNTAGDMLYWNGSAWVKVAAGTDGQTLSFMSGKPIWTGSLPANTVVSNGRIWMDRNLGASQVATSLTDAASFGDLYQWGRGTDGHEKRTSVTTNNLSSSDVPGDAIFITTTNGDWRSTKNDILWQGLYGINNPCPAGFRLPTEAEWSSERSSWSSPYEDGAFASPLKLPKAGWRGDNGSIRPSSGGGLYWSSTVSVTYLGRARPMVFDAGYFSIGDNARSYGFCVRCIKD
jgi:hypothetical protein